MGNIYEKYGSLNEYIDHLSELKVQDNVRFWAELTKSEITKLKTRNKDIDEVVVDAKIFFKDFLNLDNDAIKDITENLKFISIQLWDHFYEGDYKWFLLIYMNRAGKIITSIRKDGPEYHLKTYNEILEELPDCLKDRLKKIGECVESRQCLYLWKAIHSDKRFFAPFIFSKEDILPSKEYENIVFFHLKTDDIEVKKIKDNEWRNLEEDEHFENWGQLKPLLKETVKRFLEGDDIKFIYEFPVLLNFGSIYQEKKVYNTVGSLHISTNKELKPDTLWKIAEGFLSNPIIDILEKVVSSIYLSAFQANALKSALATIMARNMSHNIGSHALADLAVSVPDVPMSYLQDFYKFLLQRMDYIAQISSGDILRWSYPALFINEVIREFINQFLFLDRLNISEGLRAYKYEKDDSKRELRGKVIIRAGIENSQGSLQWVIDEEGIKESNGWDDFLISVPLAYVGSHAFYVILENILRNTAKHEYVKKVNEYREKYSKEDRKILYIMDGDSPEKVVCPEPYDGEIEIIKDNASIRGIIKDKKAIIIDINDTNRIDKILNELESAGYPLSYVYAPKKVNNPGNEELVQYLTSFESEKVRDFINYYCKLINENKNFATGLLKGLKDYLSSIPLRLNIKISDPGDDFGYYWITVWTDIIHPFDVVAIEREGSPPDWFVLNTYLEKSLIDELGRLRREHWGLAEMKISAVFLQKRDFTILKNSGDVYNFPFVTRIEEKADGKPVGIIKAIPVDKNGNEIKDPLNYKYYYLGYKFWVLKAKEILEVTD